MRRLLVHCRCTMDWYNGLVLSVDLFFGCFSSSICLSVCLFRIPICYAEMSIYLILHVHTLSLLVSIHLLSVSLGVRIYGMPRRIKYQGSNAQQTIPLASPFAPTTSFFYTVSLATEPVLSLPSLHAKCLSSSMVGVPCQRCVSADAKVRIPHPSLHLASWPYRAMYMYQEPHTNAPTVRR